MGIRTRILTRLAWLAGGFGYLVLLVETARALQEWWRGEARPGLWHWGALALAPCLAWIWWRYLSVFRADAVCAPAPHGRAGSAQGATTGNCRTSEMAAGETSAPKAMASTPDASAVRRARP